MHNSGKSSTALMHKIIILFLYRMHSSWNTGGSLRFCFCQFFVDGEGDLRLCGSLGYSLFPCLTAFLLTSSSKPPPLPTMCIYGLVQNFCTLICKFLYLLATGIRFLMFRRRFERWSETSREWNMTWTAYGIESASKDSYQVSPRKFRYRWQVGVESYKMSSILIFQNKNFLNPSVFIYS